MFYLLLLPVLVVMVFELRHVLRARKHDQLLFTICRVRGDLLKTIADQRLAGTLTQADYIYGRVMLNSLNQTVSLYREHRWRMFDLRAFAVRVIAYRRSARHLLAVPRTENPQLQAIDQRINRAVLEGFLAYTPMLRYHVGVAVLLFVMRLLARLGWTEVATRMAALREVLKVAHAQAIMLGQPDRFRYA